jgi:hypothetical protein
MDTKITPLSTEWRDARYSSISGTDVGKILGLDTGCSRQKLLECKRQKRDAMENCPPQTQMLLDLGRKFEGNAIEAFKTWLCSINGYAASQGFTPTLHQDPEVPYLVGSPDFIVPGLRILCEAKTHFWPSIIDAVPVQTVSEIKLKHYLQVQTYLRIMGFGVGYLVSWTMCHGHCIYQIARDDALILCLVLPNVCRFKQMMDGVAGHSPRMQRGEAASNAVAVHTSMLLHCVRVL